MVNQTTSYSFTPTPKKVQYLIVLLWHQAVFYTSHFCPWNFGLCCSRLIPGHVASYLTADNQLSSSRKVQPNKNWPTPPETFQFAKQPTNPTNPKQKKSWETTSCPLRTQLPPPPCHGLSGIHIYVLKWDVASLVKLEILKTPMQGNGKLRFLLKLPRSICHCPCEFLEGNICLCEKQMDVEMDGWFSLKRLLNHQFKRKPSSSV